MSNFNMMGAFDPEFADEEIYECEGARNCLMGMGITSENVAAAYGVTREQQDQLAVESNAKAVAADKLL